MSLAALSPSTPDPYFTTMIYSAHCKFISAIYFMMVNESIMPKVEEKVSWKDISRPVNDKRILTVAYLNFAWDLPRVSFFFIVPYLAVKNYGLFLTVAASLAGLPMLVASPIGVLCRWVCDRYGEEASHNSFYNSLSFVNNVPYVSR